MALTDVKRSKAAVWCVCDIPAYADEEHLLLPYTREAMRAVYDASQAPEWDTRTNTISREYNPNLFDPNYVERVWLGWRGIVDPKDPTKRLNGPGIIHDDGRVEDPAACTEKNKWILINSRPGEFYAWMQQKTRELAEAVHRETAQQRENFRPADGVSTPVPEAEL